MTTETPYVEYSVWLPVSDEDIVDWRIGTLEEQAAAAERIEARRAQSDAEYRALPFYEKVRRRLFYWSWRGPEVIRERVHRTLFPHCEGHP